MRMCESPTSDLTQIPYTPAEKLIPLDQPVSDLLLKAAYLAAQPKAWCQHYLGRYRDGTGTYARKRLRAIDIESRCMLGALYAGCDAEPGADIHAAYDAIVRAIGTSRVAEWNDAPSRTQNEVVAALLCAARIAEAS